MAGDSFCCGLLGGADHAHSQATHALRALFACCAVGYQGTISWAGLQKFYAHHHSCGDENETGLLL